MSQRSTEFADAKKELDIQKQQLEDWKNVIDTYPDIASKLKYVLIFQKKLMDLKAELQAIIDAPEGTATDPIRNIKLINVELPETKQALEDGKNAVIDAFSENNIDALELNFLFLEYIKFEDEPENNVEDESIDIKTAFDENISRIEEELSIMSTLEKNAKHKWQFWK